MEEESKERGDRTHSAALSTAVDTLDHTRSEEFPKIQNAEEDAADVACDGEAGENLCAGDADTGLQETLPATNSPVNADCPPLSPLPTEETLASPSMSSHLSSAHNQPSEPCWYCLRSLDLEYLPQQEDAHPLTTLSSSDHKVNYQTDPRPHFGVACSSHSTCRPLWGSEGPCWGQRHQDMSDQTHNCPHCHLGLPADTLRWHEAKCLLFEGLKTSKN